MDWKDALSAMRGNLPEGEEPEPDTTEAPAAAEKADTLHVERSVKGRAGKRAVIVSGFTCDDTGVRAVLRRLQGMMGTSGSARGGEILIQGDAPERVADALRSMGYKVK